MDTETENSQNISSLVQASALCLVLSLVCFQTGPQPPNGGQTPLSPYSYPSDFEIPKPSRTVAQTVAVRFSLFQRTNS